MKITPIIYEHREDSKGLCPIVIRITIGKKRIYRPTGEKVPAKYWANDAVKSAYPNAALINSKIEKIVSGLKAEFLREELQDRVVTVEVAKEVVPGKRKKTSLYAFCDQIIIDWKGKKKESTLEKYRHELSKLKKYAPDLDFADVTPKWLAKYEAYQRAELGNQDNTIWRSFKNLKTFFNAAKKLGVYEVYPFSKYDNPTYTNPQRTHLTKKELEKFIIEADKAKRADRIAGAFFVFSALTGLRYSDCEQFRSGLHIIEGKRILLRTTKTGEDVSLLITDRLREILAVIRPYEGIMPTNQECNRALKIIAAKAGIAKKLTFHSARHTFGFSCAEINIPIEVTAQLMGHRDTKVTAIYYHISNANADQWITKLHA